MDKITETKNEFRLRQWTQVIQDCKESDMTVAAWCEKSNINVKSYYYWLRKIRALACKSDALLLPAKQHIVPVALKQPKQSVAATIHLSSITVDIHNEASTTTIESVITALKSIC